MESFFVKCYQLVKHGYTFRNLLETLPSWLNLLLMIGQYVIDEIYEGSHFASFLPFNLCVVRGRSTILRNYGYTSNRYFYPCLLFECFIYNLPATITIETSLHEIFSLRSFEICEWKEFPIIDAFFRAHWYRLLCCKASVTPAQLEYLVFFNQKHEMNSSDFFRAHWYRLLCC